MSYFELVLLSDLLAIHLQYMFLEGGGWGRATSGHFRYLSSGGISADRGRDYGSGGDEFINIKSSRGWGMDEDFDGYPLNSPLAIAMLN